MPGTWSPAVRAVGQDARMMMIMALRDFVPTSRRIPLRKPNKHGGAARRGASQEH